MTKYTEESRELLVAKLRVEHPYDNYFDCLNCSHSFSSVENKLYCSLQNDKNVEEDDL